MQRISPKKYMLPFLGSLSDWLGPQSPTGKAIIIDKKTYEFYLHHTNKFIKNDYWETLWYNLHSPAGKYYYWEPYI